MEDFEIYLIVVGIFSIGCIVGVTLQSSLSEDLGSAEVSFEQLNMSHREVAINTSGGDRIGCTISRLNEVQISEMSYVYGNGSCTTSFQAGDSSVGVPTEEVDVLFRVNESEFDLGFDLPESYIVCELSEGEKQGAGEDSWVYAEAECSSSSGSLYEKWNDTEFENFNVHDHGQELIENQSAN